MPTTSWTASTISDDITAFRKAIFPINSRPSSPYKARMSIDGRLLPELLIADTKERTATGKTNDIVCCLNFIHKNLSYLNF